MQSAAALPVAMPICPVVRMTRGPRGGATNLANMEKSSRAGAPREVFADFSLGSFYENVDPTAGVLMHAADDERLLKAVSALETHPHP